MLSKAIALAAVAAVSAEQSILMKDWKTIGRAQPTAKKTVAMPMRDFAGLEKTLLEVSDPYNPRYGQWLTREQADAFTATEPHIVKEVLAWATSTGAICETLAESLKCEGTVAQIEELLNTELSVYAHKKTGASIIRTSAAATVLVSLTGKVILVTGLTRFPIPRLGNSRPFEVVEAINRQRVGDPDYSVVPSTLATFYNITSVDGNSQSWQGPIEFQSYPAFEPSDVAKFATNVGVTGWTVPSNQTIGPFQPEEGDAESALNEQYIGVIGMNNANWYWTETDWLYEFGQHIGQLPDSGVPKVMSMSYAWYEFDQCDISPGVQPCQGQPVPQGSYAFVIAVNQLFAKATARGITLLAASGNSGAHGRTDPGCQNTVTRPPFPAASPWVTAVGATEIAAGQTGSVPSEPICASTLKCATGGREIVASTKTLSFFSSGGGFSNVALRPSWQDAVVSSYIQNASAVPPASDFNASGRGFPDVAALGHNYYVQMGGVVAADGTTAATPVWSGIVANLNALLAAAGKPTLGFVNPLIYALYATTPSAFNDVVQGDNTCTEDACPCPAKTGFYAAPGWDATTGLGTPNYGQLKAGLVSMGILPESVLH